MPPIGRLAPSPVTTTTSSAASIRRRRQIQEEIQDIILQTQRLLVAQLDQHSKVMELRHALRDLEAENTEDPVITTMPAPLVIIPTTAIPAWIDQLQQPQKVQPNQVIPRDPNTTQSAAPTATAVGRRNSNSMNFGSTPTTTTTCRRTHETPASASNPPGTGNEPGP